MVRHRNGFFACVVLLACMMEAPSSAQTFDKRALLTFSTPVAMPGVTLPAGQYLFRLANPDKDPYVVQVVSADGTKPYGIFFSMRAERGEPAWMPEVRLIETSPGIPAPIKTWWYPGERAGYEFVYPKEQARRIAQATSQPVLTTQNETTTTEQTHTAELTRLSSAGQEVSIGAGAAPSTPVGTSQAGVLAPWTLSIVDPAIPARRLTGQMRQRMRRS